MSSSALVTVAPKVRGSKKHKKSVGYECSYHRLEDVVCNSQHPLPSTFPHVPPRPSTCLALELYLRSCSCMWIKSPLDGLACHTVKHAQQYLREKVLDV